MKNWFIGKRVLTSVISLSSVFVISCSNSTDEMINTNINPVNTIAQTQNYDSPSVITNLKDALKKENISLSNDEVSKIKDLLEIKPTGEWTPGPENNSKANLTKHYIKHKKDFKPPFTSEEDYLEAALKAANNNCDTCNYYFDRKYYTDDKIVSVVKWNSKTYELTVIRDNGQIATYFPDKTVKPSRFTLIPKVK